MKLKVVAFSLALSAFSSLALAAGQPEPIGLATLVGAPFSGVRSQQMERNFVDGNRIDNGHSVKLYRDGQGRTRIDRDVAETSMIASPGRPMPAASTIYDPVNGERYDLHPETRTAFVWKGFASPTTRPSSEAPEIFAAFGGRVYGPQDPGWSTPVSLGQKSIDGVTAQGVRRQYTIAVGDKGNTKPIVMTIEQWYSPDLGLIVNKSNRASTGGEFGFEIENIMKGEPDPALFRIPSDYTRIEIGSRVGAR